MDAGGTAQLRRREMAAVISGTRARPGRGAEVEPGGVMRQSLVRVPRSVGERPKWRGGGEGKVGVWECRGGQAPSLFPAHCLRGSVDCVKSRFQH